jgi:RNA polymerase sigma-70 factor (ECF subfamily)
VPPPPVTLDDDSFASVLAAARGGDQWAAEVLFVDLQPRLLRFLRSSEPRGADDLAGEVWLGIAQGMASFEGDLTGFRAWVFTIARRRLADHRRNAGRRATDPVDPHEYFRAQPDPSSIDGARADTATAVIGRLSAQEAVDLISSSLPPDQAEVLLLRVVADLDVAHVAEVLDRTPNWVRVTQHRALRKLAEKISGNVDESVMPDPPQAI